LQNQNDLQPYATLPLRNLNRMLLETANLSTKAENIFMDEGRRCGADLHPESLRANLLAATQQPAEGHQASADQQH
jgi:hypothetical protein